MNTSRNAIINKTKTMRTIHFSIRFISRVNLRLIRDADYLRNGFSATSLCLIFCAEDQKPKDNRQLGKWELARELINEITVTWQKQERDAAGEIAERCKKKQVAQNARDKT